MTLPEPGPDEVVIGVVVTVPVPHADVLATARLASGDPEAATLPPHVTLHGPAVVPRDDLEDVDAHLAGVARRHGPFVVHLRGTGTFRPVSPVVFVALARGIADCEQLERSVRCGPLDAPLRFPYHPHVTVAQDVEDETLDAVEKQLGDFDGTFVVTAIDRYVHDADGQWRPMRRFPLTGRAGRPADVPEVSP
ncbi:MAG TPA: 2'-5' RNA ligase family protein [Rugosimonospora sp.]|nr:2'-5' RNA ligase family protein [Rugosimonospora sp.]